MMKRCNRNVNLFTDRNYPLLFRLFGLLEDKHEETKGEIYEKDNQKLFTVVFGDDHRAIFDSDSNKCCRSSGR